MSVPNDGTAITIKIKHGITVHKISIKVLCDVFEGIGFFEALRRHITSERLLNHQPRFRRCCAWRTLVCIQGHASKL